jgi:hypothetical protein
MKQIDPAAFCSRGSYVHVPFCSEVPESSKLEDVCEASFWSLLPKMISRSQNLLHKGQVIRLHTPDFSWDTLFVIVGFRADTTPMLRRWPIDEKSSATESIPGWKKRRAEALATLELDASATDAEIKAAGTKLRAAFHPDQSHDEADRVMREARSKDINVAIDTLLKKVGA